MTAPDHSAQPCQHPATLSVTGRPGVRFCPTCGAHLTRHDDGTTTTEVRGA